MKRILKQDLINKIVAKTREELLHVTGSAELEFQIDGLNVWVEVMEWHASDGSGRWGREIHECAINDENFTKEFEDFSVPCAVMDMSLFRESVKHY